MNLVRLVPCLLWDFSSGSRWIVSCGYLHIYWVVVLWTGDSRLNHLLCKSSSLAGFVIEWFPWYMALVWTLTQWNFRSLLSQPKSQTRLADWSHTATGVRWRWSLANAAGCSADGVWSSCKKQITPWNPSCRETPACFIFLPSCLPTGAAWPPELGKLLWVDRRCGNPLCVGKLHWEVVLEPGGTGKYLPACW